MFDDRISRCLPLFPMHACLLNQNAYICLFCLFVLSCIGGLL